MLRKVGVLTLLLGLALLATDAAQATPLLAGSSRPAESAGVFAKVWDWITQLFQRSGESQGAIKASWEADGSHMDPNGGPH